MAESTVQSRIEVPADDLFRYLSQVSNLPEYFPKMTSATSVDDGTQVEGEAWFRVDHDARSIE